MTEQSDKQQRAEQLIEAMRAKRGYLYPEWEWAARQDPDFMAIYDQFANQVLLQGVSEEGKALPIKVRELIAIVLLAQRGSSDGLRTHMRRALTHGATKQEIFEALQVAIVPSGAPTFLNGLRVLRSLDDEDAKG